MKKHLLLAAMLLTATASVGTFTACSNEDLKPVNDHKVVEGTTSMSVQFALQLPDPAVRAAADGQNLDDPQHNYVGKWMGNDLIESVDVYIFKADAAAPGASHFSLEKEASLGPTDFTFEQPKAGQPNFAFIRPTKGFKVHPGNKRVFVVVNPTTETKAQLASLTDFDAFAEKYNDVLKLKTAAGADAPTKYTETEATAAAAATDPFTVADHVARLNGTGTQQKDVITMTGTYGEVAVVDGVSETQTISTAAAPPNRATVSVQRVVARVLVTSDKDKYEIMGDDPTTADKVETVDNGDAVKLVTITNLTYVVAQGESSFYLDQQNSPEPDNYKFKTPNSTYVPAGTATDYRSDYDVDATYEKYDYTGLWRNKTNHFGGRNIVTNATYNASVDNVVKYVQNQDGLHGEFLLANTHKYNADDRGASGYRKGNTAYVLVRGKIEPEYVWTGENTYVRDWAATHPNDDLFLGDDGKFYASAELANNPTTSGNAAATAMKVKKFVGGKVLYFVWVNPDKTKGTEWINSPAIRNNIYHIQIKGIANYVYNWNPLVPNTNEPVDPNKPVDPKTNPRRPNNPNNPDPQPGVPDPNDPNKQIPDPKEPPTDIKPNDPLSLKEAWMSVDVTILPWQVHTFEHVLGE